MERTIWPYTNRGTRDSDRTIFLRNCPTNWPTRRLRANRSECHCLTTIQALVILRILPFNPFTEDFTRNLATVNREGQFPRNNFPNPVFSMLVFQTWSSYTLYHSPSSSFFFFVQFLQNCELIFLILFIEQYILSINLIFLQKSTIKNTCSQ